MPTDALVSQSSPSLLNGVSQQPSHQRDPSQAEAQENCVSDVADGVKRRPPAEHVALLGGSVASGSPAEGYFHHTIDRGDGEKFHVFIEDGDINVFDLSDGSEVTVNDTDAAGTPGAYTYLDTSAAASKDSFEAVTVADYTFILNKTKTAAMSSAVSTARENAHEFLLSIKFAGQTSSVNKITLNFAGTDIVHASPGTGGAANLMNHLCTALCSNTDPSDVTGTVVGVTEDWKFTRVNETLLYAYQFQGVLDEITCSDEFSDQIHELMTTGTSGEDPSIRAFSDLPHEGRDGFSVKIEGADGNDDDEFYVEYVQAERVWKEAEKPGLQDRLDGDVMPHALVYDAVAGDFDFQPLSWTKRKAGDTLSAPEPSFIAQEIKDILVHQGRLTVIARENAILSEAGDFFNYFPVTVTTLVDSDPLDIAGTSATVGLWDYAVPFQGGLTLMAATGPSFGELVGGREKGLTIESARIEERDAFALSLVRPKAIGSALYFVYDNGARTSVFNYAEVDQDIFRATEMTAHIKEYVPTGVFKMAESRAEDFLCFLSNKAGEQHRVYTFRFHFSRGEQLMSSWSRWTFAEDDVILDAEWSESVCYLVIERQDGIHLEKLDFGKSDEDEGAGATPLGYRVHLDSLVKLTGTYSAITDLTTWTIPYDQATNGGTYTIVRGGAWGASSSVPINVNDASTDLSITAEGDHSANAVYIGREYDSDYELSEHHLRGGGSTRSVAGARIAGRLQLRQGKFSYTDTAAFNVEVLSNDDDDVYSYPFTSQLLNKAVFGPTVPEDGVFDFPIGGHSENVRVIATNSSFLPFTLSSYEWEGRYFQRSSQA